MKKLTWLLVLLMILMAVPHGAALASSDTETPVTTPTALEEVIGNFIFEGYWDVWGSKSNWQNGYGPGSKNLSIASDPVYPCGWAEGSRGLKDLLRRYELTRAEVMYVYPLDEDKYNDAGGRYGKPWGDSVTQGTFYADSYIHMADNPRATIKSFDPSTGHTVVEWTIDYPQKANPADPESAPRGPEGEAFNTKVNLDRVDHRFISAAELQALMANPNAEGWRVYFPAVVCWYGIPKPEVNLIAVDIDPGVDEPEPGKWYTGTAIFANDSAMKLVKVPVGVYQGDTRLKVFDEQGQALPALQRPDGKWYQVADFEAYQERTFTFHWSP